MRLPALDPRRLGAILLTLAIGAAGGAAAASFDVPAGWLIGAAVAVTIAAVSGVDTSIPPRLRDLAFVSIGLSMGSGVSHETITESARWPLSLVMVVVCVAVIIAAVYAYLRVVNRYDRGTALLSAVPGVLSYNVALALEGYGEARTVALVQSIRLIVLITTVPLFVDLVSTVGPQPDRPIMAPLAIVGVIVAGFAAGALCAKLRIPAPYLIGGMLVSVGAHLTDTVVGGLPLWLVAPGFIITGCLTGSRFAGITGAELRAAVGAGVMVMVVASLISAAFALAVAVLLAMPFGQVWVAFAPGGVEAMVAIALSLDLDPTYVAAHHVLRFVVISLAMPMIIAAMRLQKRAAA